MIYRTEDGCVPYSAGRAGALLDRVRQETGKGQLGMLAPRWQGSMALRTALASYAIGLHAFGSGAWAFLRFLFAM